MFHFRDSLLEHVLGVNEGTDTAMVKQLALALADLALLMHAEWPTAVQDLANQVNGHRNFAFFASHFYSQKIFKSPLLEETKITELVPCLEEQSPEVSGVASRLGRRVFKGIFASKSMIEF